MTDVEFHCNGCNQFYFGFDLDVNHPCVVCEETYCLNCTNNSKLNYQFCEIDFFVCHNKEHFFMCDDCRFTCKKRIMERYLDSINKMNKRRRKNVVSF